ncbi:hypothetical protein RJT34_23229 [Clitoria ternatea]|uniref:DUF761 domain-containing protein n=1 Tax=Clitoria ternatea TaxID=43366 RepID=A0AAN9FKR0_CLITE
MDPKAENSMIVVSNHHDNELNKTIQPQLKKKGSKNFFTVALYMMRGRSRKTKVLPADEESKSVWRKLVGSMRPLHLQSNVSPPPKTIVNHQQHMMITSSPLSNGYEGFESATDVTYSPSLATSSRYASAVGLNEMVEEEEEESGKEEVVVKENCYIDDDGDEMIDAKAEEFIAQFYQQMRMQDLDATNLHYRELSLRSLGL